MKIKLDRTLYQLGLSNKAYDIYLDITDAMSDIDTYELSDKQEIDAFYKAIVEWVNGRKEVVNNRYN